MRITTYDFFKGQEKLTRVFDIEEGEIVEENTAISAQLVYTGICLQVENDNLKKKLEEKERALDGKERELKDKDRVLMKKEDIIAKLENKLLGGILRFLIETFETELLAQ